MSQSMIPSANSSLKWGHPSNQDTLTGPKGGRIRGSPLYSIEDALGPWRVPCSCSTGTPVLFRAHLGQPFSYGDLKGRCRLHPPCMHIMACPFMSILWLCSRPRVQEITWTQEVYSYLHAVLQFVSCLSDAKLHGVVRPKITWPLL